MASIDNALSTVARAKSYMGVTGSTKDLLIQMLLLSVTQFIQDTYCKRKFKRQTYTNELYSSKGGKRLWLKARPIIAGTSVILQKRTNATNTNDWQTIDSENYFVNYEAGNLELIRYNDEWLGLGSEFIPGVQNYRVTYTGGYYLPSASEYQDGTDDDQDLPYDLEMAALHLVSADYNLRQSAGISSQRVGEISLSYAKELDKHPQLKATLDKYRVLSYK